MADHITTIQNKGSLSSEFSAIKAITPNLVISATPDHSSSMRGLFHKSSANMAVPVNNTAIDCCSSERGAPITAAPKVITETRCRPRKATLSQRRMGW